MNELTKSRIREHIASIMDRTIRRRVVTEPFNEQEVAEKNPFGYRLVPVEIWKGAKFERSFVTTLGQNIFEQIAKMVAEGTGAIAINQYERIIRLNTWKEERIEQLLTEQRSPRANNTPNWDSELTSIKSLDNDRYIDVNVRFDLYIQRVDGTEEFYGLKTVKPNLDQTERAKRDMLRLASCENAEVYFALPYNPAGENCSYRLARHNVPFKIFDMDNDSCVLIGRDFWNKVGNDDNTYDELLEVFSELGEYYSNVIRKDYLGISD